LREARIGQEAPQAAIRSRPDCARRDRRRHLTMASGRTVMLVSRDAGDREFYAEHLRQFNLLPLAVSAPHEALLRLTQFRVSAVLLHLRAPDEGSSYREIVAAARPTPVLVLASIDMLAQVALQQALEACGAEIVAEPCPPSSLAGRLWRAIGGERTNRDSGARTTVLPRSV